ncbi:unnamed protein product [Rotaria magnacalcarata]|uniref:Uncharacterized protein n=2 Tax=Rotaria magnacalcarata TaxID=392030 RepID=A0A820K216_9BILA|nr:unnamed protein product [Rotaria magnacalcarata]CAF2128347.1 unnamed protein product [Rotaria magnacalcarata]CAF3931024.1 unnamed protein product [Rotaria magnacalcarata]CAF4336804.1 unnamed protein product [Rotaria magnacalcarata]
MSQRLSTGSYIILIMINISIALGAVLSMGIFHGHSQQLDWAMLRLDSFKQNRSKIFEYIRSNCSQLIVEYPEFYTFPQAELCDRYGFSLKLGKTVVVLSILYDIYLLNGLYNAHRLVIIIMGIMSTLVFYINVISDEWTVELLGSILTLLGFIMIIGQYLFPNFDEHVKKQWLKLNNRLSKNKNRHIYDNIRNKKDKHQD